MIYPDVSLKTWLKKHPELRVFESHCHPCGKVMKSTRPFISKGYVGIESEPCPCGKGQNKCSSSVTTTKEEHESWLKALGEL